MGGRAVGASQRGCRPCPTEYVGWGRNAACGKVAQHASAPAHTRAHALADGVYRSSAPGAVGAWKQQQGGSPPHARSGMAKASARGHMCAPCVAWKGAQGYAYRSGNVPPPSRVGTRHVGTLLLYIAVPLVCHAPQDGILYTSLFWCSGSSTKSSSEDAAVHTHQKSDYQATVRTGVQQTCGSPRGQHGIRA